MRLSVIVPALNEEGVLAAALNGARAPGVLEVIVVDGGSDDSTVDVARALADVVRVGARGRAAQMNDGVAASHGDVLLFLHADTILPAGFDAAVHRALDDPRVVGGRFDLRLVPSSFLLWLTGELINLRSRLTRIATGDQAIFVRRAVFEEMGGFPLLPLMEDVAFTTALKSRGRIACLRERVVTSSRRWVRNGVIRTVLLMWSLRLLYFFGVAPERLAQLYRDAR
jgi:rSAM/selenodomain-associated transferase 2